MGTNYFAIVNLGGPRVKLHIGKSSIGWCFALHVTDGIASLADWRRVWAQAFVTIEDEYGAPIDADAMLEIIKDRVFQRPSQPEAAWFVDNCATRGPHGLARQTYHATMPPDPANDTYTLISGDFS